MFNETIVSKIRTFCIQSVLHIFWHIRSM